MQRRIHRGVSTLVKDDAWRYLGSNECRSLLSNKVLVVSSDFEGVNNNNNINIKSSYIEAGVKSSSKRAELTRRVWFELQKIGKQVVFYTVPNVLYPTYKCINEGILLAKRTGVRSIISIGSGEVLDYAKGLRSIIESDANELDNYDDKKISKIKIPLLTVSTTLSPVSFTNTWFCLHKEDDRLLRRYCRPADVTLMDNNIIQNSSNYLLPASVNYSFSYLFDTIFAYCLYLRKHKNVVEYNILRDMFLDNYNKICHQDEQGGVDQHQYNHNLVQLRSQLDQEWNGICELLSFIVSIKVGNSNPIPYSWLMGLCVDAIINNHNNNYKYDSKNIIDLAILDSINIFMQIHGNRGIHDISSNVSIILNKIGSCNKNTAHDGKNNTTNVGLVEGVIVSEEMDHERDNNDGDNSDKNNQNLRLMLLKSDYFIDILDSISDKLKL